MIAGPSVDGPSASSGEPLGSAVLSSTHLQMGLTRASALVAMLTNRESFGHRKRGADEYGNQSGLTLEGYLLGNSRWMIREVAPASLQAHIRLAGHHGP